MIGAGIAWLAISSRRRDDDDYETGYSAGYSSGYRSGTEHDEHKEGMTDRLKQRASAAGESHRERASDLGERAGELGPAARRRARHYGRSGGRSEKDPPIMIRAARIAHGAHVASDARRGGKEWGITSQSP